MKRITATLAALAIAAGLAIASTPTAEAAKLRRPLVGCSITVYHHGLPRTIHVRCHHDATPLPPQTAPIPQPPKIAQ